MSIPYGRGYPPDPPDITTCRREALGVLGRSELAELPPITPLITDTLDRRSMAVLAGYWGTGKSFVALDWACSVATGTPWLGRSIDNTDTKNRVLYIVDEGAYGVHQRLLAWETEHEVSIGVELSVLPRAVNLINTAETTKLAQLVADESIDLVVVDTLSRCMPGAEENSAKDMSTAVKHLDSIRTARAVHSPLLGSDDGGTCVLLVHHTGKDKSTIRGSSVLEGAADTVYQIEGDGQRISLNRTKRKDGPRDDSHQLAIRWVPGTDSASVRPMSAAEKRSNKDSLLSVFMSAFSVSGASKMELRLVAEMPPASFHRALNALVKEGLLLNVGTEERPFFKAGDPS